MTKISIGLGAVLVAVAIAFTIVAATLPSEWHVERATVVDASPAAIFAWLNDLHRWPEWSPWNDHRDPTLKQSFAGPERGAGAAMRWQAEAIGSGRLVLTTSLPYEKVGYDLFLDDAMLPAKGSITMVSQATGTLVTWSEDGDMGANLFGRFAIDEMDETLGPDLEAALGALKNKVELAEKDAGARREEPQPTADGAAADDTVPDAATAHAAAAAPAPTDDPPAPTDAP
ncbi:MAG: SRPBCC family protein [Deltaproteobacteria bacterium]|nr:SRPBCC family protein [Deltaproteobacteria bacterium]